MRMKWRPGDELTPALTVAWFEVRSNEGVTGFEIGSGR
jgi:hypothetical protein